MKSEELLEVSFIVLMVFEAQTLNVRHTIQAIKAVGFPFVLLFKLTPKLVFVPRTVAVSNFNITHFDELLHDNLLDSLGNICLLNGFTVLFGHFRRLSRDAVRKTILDFGTVGTVHSVRY